MSTTARVILGRGRGSSDRSIGRSTLWRVVTRPPGEGISSGSEGSTSEGSLFASSVGVVVLCSPYRPARPAICLIWVNARGTSVLPLYLCRDSNIIRLILLKSVTRVISTSSTLYSQIQTHAYRITSHQYLRPPVFIVKVPSLICPRLRWQSAVYHCALLSSCRLDQFLHGKDIASTERDDTISLLDLIPVSLQTRLRYRPRRKSVISMYCQSVAQRFDDPFQELDCRFVSAQVDLLGLQRQNS